MIPWQFCWNNLLLRPIRTLLTSLGIAGGVAAVVAVLQATNATQSHLDSLHQMMESRVALEIVKTDGTPFSEEAFPSVAELPGIRAAIPQFRAFADITAEREQVRGIALGIDLELYQLVRDFRFVSGRACTEADEICVEVSMAERLKIAVGSTLRLRSRGIPLAVSKTVVGILELQGIGTLQETASFYLPLTEAGRLEKAAGKITAVQIVLERHAQSAKVAAAMKSRLPTELVVNKPASAADLSQPTEALVNISLNVAATLSVVAAIFIVVNTLMISVAERQRQLALLRIVGGSIEQIRAAMYREVLLLGIAGTLVGVILGLLGSHSLAHGIQDAFGFETSRIGPGVRPILAGLIFGPLVTLASAWQPIRLACKTPPLAVIKSAFSPHRSAPMRTLTVMGCGALVVSLLMCTVSAAGILSLWTSVIGMAFLIAAGVMFLPTLIRPAAFVLYRPFRRTFPVEVQLGRSQILDNFGRSSLTIGVLFVVTATSICIGNATLGITQDIQSWMDRVVTSDFLLRASRPRVDMSETDPVSDEFEAQLAAIPHITSVDRVTFSLVGVNGLSATLMVRQFRGYKDLPIDLRDGDLRQVRKDLLAGEVVIGTVLAHKLGVRRNDFVRIEASGMNQQIKVAGIIQEYTAGGLMAVMDRDAAQQIFPIEQTHVYMISSDPAATASVGIALQSSARELGLIFQSLSDCRRLIHGMVTGVTNQLWLILILALLIAGFAIVNTLTMNVIVQTRSLGVLRVVGMSQRQVIHMFLLQAFILGLMALLPGSIMGVIVAYLVTIFFRSVSDHDVPFTLNTGLLAGYLVLGLLLSLAAAILPAIRAARLNPLQAIHQE